MKRADIRQLERGFAADVQAQQRATADLVRQLAGVRHPTKAGAHSRRSLEQIVRDSGFSDAGELDAVLRIDGRAYR